MCALDCFDRPRASVPCHICDAEGALPMVPADRRGENTAEVVPGNIGVANGKPVDDMSADLHRERGWKFT